MLEKALDLSGTAREAFLAEQPAHLAETLRRLLDSSENLTLETLSDQAAAGIHSVTADAQTGMAGRWRLHEALGAGGMGQVFYATRREPGEVEAAHSDYQQRAAIKVMWSHQTRPETMRRFFRERRILAALDHPGLARFLDGGFLADGRPWFAMEFVEGRALLEHARDTTRSERIQLILQVCDTLAYAHQRLIVHRDIKPANLLVDASGRVRLLDFGVAGVLDDTNDGVETRLHGTPMTLMYASPEQVRGDTVTVASDVYQVGGLLYQLLTERAPHAVKDLSLEQAVDQILNQSPERPTHLDPKIPRDLEHIVLRAMHKDPNLRYASIEALSEDLERYLDGRPVQAMAPSTWYVASRFVRRNKAMVSVLAVSFLTLGLATLVSLQQAELARQEASRSAVTQQILADVFTEADPFGGGGANITLADALVEAQPRIEARVAGDPELAWDVHKTLSEIYTELGLTDQERRTFRNMLDAARARGDEADALLAIAGLGNVLARTDPAAAVAFLTEEVPDLPDQKESAEPWLYAQYALVGAHGRLRDFVAVAEGAQRMQTVVDRFSIDSPRLRGQLSQVRAGVSRREGATEEEMSHWRQALAFARATERLGTIAVAASNYGIALMRHGDPVGSEAAFKEAIELYADADHRDATLATILRNYAGFLFRTDHYEQAMATSEDALQILDPNAQAYARFVTGLNMLYYTFAHGEPERTVRLATSVVRDALARLGEHDSARDRTRGILAKVFTFAELPGLASRTLGFGECLTRSQLFAELDPYEAENERNARARLWSSQTSQAAWPVDTIESLVFFDVLDRDRLASAMNLKAREDALAPLKQQTRESIAMEYDAVEALVSLVSPTVENTPNC